MGLLPQKDHIMATSNAALSARIDQLQTALDAALGEIAVLKTALADRAKLDSDLAVFLEGVRRSRENKAGMTREKAIAIARANIATIKSGRRIDQATYRNTITAMRDTLRTEFIQAKFPGKSVVSDTELAQVGYPVGRKADNTVVQAWEQLDWLLSNTAAA